MGDHDRAVWALIAGGGTAGHVLPGLAIASALVATGHDPGTILFVGSERGIERRLVPEAGFALTMLPGRGIQRRITRDNIAAVAGLLRAVVQALRLVRRARPAVVVCLGGYASVPPTLAALVWRTPVVIAEQNAVPGLANRIFGRIAAASAVSFPATPLPRAVLTGNPVRAEVLAVDRAAQRDRSRAVLGIDPGRTLVVAFGGSLGARRINEAVFDLVEAWRGRADVAVRHVLGERDWERFASRTAALVAHRAAGGVQYQPVRYEDDMPTVYAAADLAVCRSGATTVADLAVVGLPAVLIPLPGAPGDHQTANARALVGAGAAVLVADADCDGARLATEIGELLAAPARLATMSASARAVAHPDAGRRVAALIEEHARG